MVKLGINEDELGGRFSYNPDMGARKWFCVSEDDLMLLAQHAFQTARADRTTKIKDLHHWKNCVAYPTVKPWVAEDLADLRDRLDDVIKEMNGLHGTHF